MILDFASRRRQAQYPRPDCAAERTTSLIYNGFTDYRGTARRFRATGNHDRNYCPINGVADRALGRLGIFQSLERLVTAMTGVKPRPNDAAWALRYGRPR